MVFVNKFGRKAYINKVYFFNSEIIAVFEKF